MRKILFLLMSVAILSLTSCETDYYEPVFGYDDLPEVIPQSGGMYDLSYDYEYYDTRASLKENFEWEYRVLINGEEYYSGTIQDRFYNTRDMFYFTVEIPRNNSAYPRSVMVEVSTHVVMDYEDWWGDWTPIASSVQLGL